MKRFLCLITLLTLQQTAFGQGGIGNVPRSDLVMLSAVVRDSLSDEAYAQVLLLKHYGEAQQIDSASQIVAYNGAPVLDKKWARPTDSKVDAEKARVTMLLDKLQKLYVGTEIHREYFAVFKDKDNPAGEKILYQINFQTGKKKHMVSITFYPIGDKLMLGDIQ